MGHDMALWMNLEDVYGDFHLVNLDTIREIGYIKCHGDEGYADVFFEPIDPVVSKDGEGDPFIVNNTIITVKSVEHAKMCLRRIGKELIRKKKSNDIDGFGLSNN